MNLLELITKSDRNVTIQSWDAKGERWQAHESPRSCFSKIVRPRVRFYGWCPHVVRDTVRGLLLRSGTRVLIKQAGRFWSNYAQGDGVFRFRSNGSGDVKVVVGWSADGGETLISEKVLIARKRLSDFTVPATTSAALDLVIQVPLQKGAKLFLGVHRLLDRQQLYSRCKGIGVEVGPGPKPQILPGSDIQVKYIEQATPDQWQKLYGRDTKVPVDPSLWDLYVVGNADSIPASPASLDFVFSSHVLEHLANPLGHLAYWATLLKPGGIVAAVIPDRDGCKDYVFLPSSVTELEAEYRRGSMNPTLEHYKRWAKHRAPNVDPEEIFSSGRSIHVHFYTPNSMANVMVKMHRELGFREFNIISEYNHKDFFLLLRK